MPSIRELRVLIQHQGALRSLCKIAFSNRDASLYFFPYSLNRRYFFGGRSMPDTIFEDKVDFSQGIRANTTPKLSIHETGQVHVQASTALAGPLFVPPLSDWRGQHAATICPDALSSLPEYPVSPKDRGQSIDRLIEVPDRVESIRLAVYIAGDRPSFETPNCPIIITLKRRTIQNPLYVALKPIPQSPIGVDLQAGVTILAGWNPTNQREQGLDYIYIRGE
jgi:hypothetical protein